MLKLKSLLVAFFLIGLLNVSPVLASAGQQSWQQWLKDLRAEALAQGIRPKVFDEAFRGMKAPSRKVLHYDRTQPEKRLTFLKYRNTRADNYRIVIGRKEYRKHRQMLNEVAQKYGVSPCFIVSLWGLESSYGKIHGKLPRDSLTGHLSV